MLNGDCQQTLNGGTLADCEKVPQATATRKPLRLYPEDTIVFAKSGMSATLGRVYRLTEPAYVVSHLAALVPTGKYDPAFLTYWLRRNPPSHLIKDPAYPSIRVGEIAGVEVPAVPLKDQRRIAAILDKADDIRRKHEHLRQLTANFVKSAYLNTIGHLNPQYDEWKSFTIERLAESRRGAIRSGPFGSALRHSEFIDKGIAVMGIDNAVQNKFSWGKRRFIAREKYESLRRYQVFPNDVIITIMGTTGRSAVVPDCIPESITTKHLATITCDTSKILPDILSFAIHSDPMVGLQMKSYKKGAIMDGLNLGIIKKLVLKIPPMEEQFKFSKIVKKTDAMMTKSEVPNVNVTNLFNSLTQRAFLGKL